MAVKSSSKSLRGRIVASKDAGTVAFVVRFFKVVSKHGNIGNLRLQNEPMKDTVFFRDFRHLEELIKSL